MGRESGKHIEGRNSEGFLVCSSRAFPRPGHIPACRFLVPLPCLSMELFPPFLLMVVEVIHTMCSQRFLTQEVMESQDTQHLEGRQRSSQQSRVRRGPIAQRIEVGV